MAGLGYLGFEKMPAEADCHRLDIERLHEGMVVELDRRFSSRGERPETAEARRGGDADVDAEVASTISIIRQAASALNELQQIVRKQEKLIYNQRQMITDLQHQKQLAAAELADAVRGSDGERDRADRAESRLQSSEAQIKRLEDYSVSLKSHLTNLMAVVRESLASVGRTATAHATA